MYCECRSVVHKCNSDLCKKAIENFQNRRPICLKWDIDRADPFGSFSRPDWPIFDIGGFDILGHYWINQTHRETTHCYIARCQKLFQRRLSRHITEAKFVARVVLGLRSFSRSVACYVCKTETFQELRLQINYLDCAGDTLGRLSWKQFLFPNDWIVSKRLVRAYIDKVRLLRESLRAPQGLIGEVQRLFIGCVRHLRTSRERGLWDISPSTFWILVRLKIQRCPYFREKIAHRISTVSLYKSRVLPQISYPPPVIRDV